ncbi:transcriptional regulator [Acrocarpospora pleiomorpha]|uniref:Transcriptional regulator n=1 Tax=Acrocarpospora pleiomorpha TaxID=90975 RepID=A0A5M3XHQ6_9ACTN|nr:MarR family transcriptional regulator [Acrocarpospora pleiomorpha]GES19749.1 transcriptional regulator [Acrocarpospora pleiomorpha]
MHEVIADIEREFMLIGRYKELVATADGAEERRLERSSYILLRRLEVKGPMSIGQLAHAFSLDTSTVNRQTTALLRGGLAERIPDPDGGMARKLRITEQGLRRVDEERTCRLNGLARVLKNWTPEELAAFADGLAHFNASIERAVE